MILSRRVGHFYQVRMMPMNWGRKSEEISLNFMLILKINTYKS